MNARGSVQGAWSAHHLQIEARAQRHHYFSEQLNRRGGYDVGGGGSGGGDVGDGMEWFPKQ